MHHNNSNVSVKLSIALCLTGWFLIGMVVAASGCHSERSDWAHYGAVHDAASHGQELAQQTLQQPPEPQPSPQQLPQPQEPAQAKPVAATTAASFKIKRLVLTEGVNKREPVNDTKAFPHEAKRIYAFVEVSNPERADGAVYVSFAPAGGQEGGAIKLRVGPSSRWRTWAYTRKAKQPGAWQTFVRDDQGELLAKAAFEVHGAKQQLIEKEKQATQAHEPDPSQWAADRI